MFSTLRCSGDENGLVQTSYKPFPYPEDHTKQRPACLNCRNKKLKCIGEKSGCVRCNTKKIKCTYPSSVWSKAPQNKPQSPRHENIPTSPRRRCKGSKEESESDGAMEWEDGHLSGGEEGESKLGSPKPLMSPSSSSAEFAKCAEGPGTVSLSKLVDEHPGRADMLPFEFEISDLYADSTVLGDGFVPEEGIFDFAWDAGGLSSGSYSFADAQIPQQAISALISACDSRDSDQKAPVTPSQQVRVAGTTSSGSNESSCRCIHNLLDINESLEIAHNARVGNTFDQTLSQNKRFIAQCQVMIICRDCSKNSALVMLIVSICEKLIASFKNLISQDGDTASDVTSRTTSVDNCSQSPKVGSGSRCRNNSSASIPLGVYSIDTFEESSSVMGVLTEIQINSFQRLLSKLDSLITMHDWTHLQTKLDTINRGCVLLAQICKQSVASRSRFQKDS